MTGTPTYKSWSCMKSRCLNAEDGSYVDYGGRGIRVCERWLTFENFLADMGVKPKHMTIERKDTNGNYEPDNCVWADRTAQNRNRRYTKLTERLATTIRAERAQGATFAALAARHGIAVSHAHRICSGESWR